MFKFYNKTNFYLLKNLFFLSTLICTFPAFSGEVIKSQVSYTKKHYEAILEIQIKAPAKKVYALFTDFDYLSRLSDNITGSTLISNESPEYIVEVETHTCVLFFCKDLFQTQKVTEHGEGHIFVEDIKDKSDFIYANTSWHIRALDKGTRVTFQSEMKPDFWLPPILGPWLFKKRMIKDTKAMIERLEKLANNDN